jgi:diguanylate cyclase (GGDEF)-like protein
VDTNDTAGSMDAEPTDAERIAREVDARMLRRAMDLRRLPERVGLALALLAVALVGLADYVSGDNVTVALFFLVPVIIATWTCRPRVTVLVAVLSGAVGLLAMLTTSGGDESVVHAFNGLTRTLFYVSFAYVALLVRRLVDVLEVRAHRDELTGLLNRRAYYQAVEVDRQRARRSGRPISVLYMDLDNLKVVNDDHGHEAGDVLLAGFARRLQASLRPGDWAARLGGDEFSVCLADAGPQEARAAVTHLQEDLASPLPGGLRAGASIGCATFLEMPDDVETMVHAADQLMYAAKRDERGSVRCTVLPTTEAVA